MSDPEITVKTVKSIVKVPWRLRLKWWWMQRKFSDVERQIAKDLAWQEHLLFINGECPRTGRACHCGELNKYECPEAWGG